MPQQAETLPTVDPNRPGITVRIKRGRKPAAADPNLATARLLEIRTALEQYMVANNDIEQRTENP